MVLGWHIGSGMVLGRVLSGMVLGGSEGTVLGVGVAWYGIGSGMVLGVAWY